MVDGYTDTKKGSSLMIKDLFWHGVVLTVIGFFALTATSRLPQWQSNVDIYAPPQSALAQNNDHNHPAAQTQHLAQRIRSIDGIELARAR